MLFSLPGALGRSLGPLCRGDFLGIQAPPKRGKSWWLWFIAYRASRLGLKVVFFNLEMTEEQMLRRSWCCYTGKPEKAGKLQMPYFDDNGSVSSSPKEFSAAFSSKEAVEASQRKFRMLTRGGDVRIEFFPSDSLTVGQIETQLQNLEEYENFVPDVVVVDYADLLLADDTRLEYRHRLDSIWKKLRGLAQLRGCLVATATQGGIRKVESDKIVGVGDVAEDARKLAHVTKFITLNQTKDDKKKGVMRVSTSLQREAFGEDSGKDVIVLQNLSIGRPYIDSRLREDTEYADESTYNKKSHTHKEE
jgi:replicative DNA helicase